MTTFHSSWTTRCAPHPEPSTANAQHPATARGGQGVARDQGQQGHRRAHGGSPTSGQKERRGRLLEAARKGARTPNRGGPDAVQAPGGPHLRAGAANGRGGLDGRATSTWGLSVRFPTLIAGCSAPIGALQVSSGLRSHAGPAGSAGIVRGGGSHGPPLKPRPLLAPIPSRLIPAAPGSPAATPPSKPKPSARPRVCRCWSLRTPWTRGR